MNILLWVIQIALTLLNLAGGSYKLFQYDELAKVPAAGALSRGAWARLASLRSCARCCLSSPPP